jgi:hypothetical protein
MCEFHKEKEAKRNILIIIMICLKTYQCKTKGQAGINPKKT